MSVPECRRIDGPTPSGGDYAEIYFYDENGEAASESTAAQCVIHEYKQDGTLLMSTYSKCTRQAE